jgi:hypothetical protein
MEEMERELFQEWKFNPRLDDVCKSPDYVLQQRCGEFMVSPQRVLYFIEWLQRLKQVGCQGFLHVSFGALLLLFGKCVLTTQDFPWSCVLWHTCFQSQALVPLCTHEHDYYRPLQERAVVYLSDRQPWHIPLYTNNMLDAVAFEKMKSAWLLNRKQFQDQLLARFQQSRYLQNWSNDLLYALMAYCLGDSARTNARSVVDKDPPEIDGLQEDGLHILLPQLEELPDDVHHDVDLEEYDVSGMES